MFCIKNVISIGIEAFQLIISLIGIGLVVCQLKVSRETNNMPLLRLVEVEEGFKDNEYVDYVLNDNKEKKISPDKCYTVYFKNVGRGLARDIQMYSLNIGTTSELQLKTISRSRIKGDVEIENENTTGINIRIVKSDIKDLRNINFLLTYKNVYRDINYGILTISDYGNNVGGMFFNSETNGFNTIFRSLKSKYCIDKLIGKSKDKNNSNWDIE